MTSSSDAMPDTEATPRGISSTAAASSWTRTLYWSVRRELWENRSIYLAPAITAAVVVFAILVGTIWPPRIIRAGSGHAIPAATLHTLPYGIAAAAIMLIGIVVGVFYCLGALQGERRDRSILFWKSLPVSDLVTVLSKAIIPFAVLPVCIFATVVATHLVMLVLHSAMLLAHGQNPALLLSEVPVLRLWGVLAYGLVTFALWWAPIYGWLMLVSAWARRMTFLWAVAPPIGLCIFEKLAFDSTHVAGILGHRLGGSAAEAFRASAKGSPDFDLPDIDPLKFLAGPGLWIGLLVGAGFFAAAIWLRRRSEPI